MKNLPEGAGSPISQMPQSTKGGLQPTHQPILLTRLLLELIMP